MRTELLCLPKPYGWPEGTGISMQARPGTEVNGDVVAGLVLGWGCPSFILPRVSSAMQASGRYDCRVTVSQRALVNLRSALNAIGIDLLVQVEERNLEPDSADDLR